MKKYIVILILMHLKIQIDLFWALSTSLIVLKALTLP